MRSRAKVDTPAGTPGGSGSKGDPLPFAAGFAGRRPLRFRAAEIALDKLGDQGLGAQATVRRRDVDLKGAGDLVGSQPARDSHAVLVRYHDQVSRSVGKFAAGAGDRQREDHARASERLVVVVFDLHNQIARSALPNFMDNALSLNYQKTRVLRG